MLNLFWKFRASTLLVSSRGWRWRHNVPAYVDVHVMCQHKICHVATVLIRPQLPLKVKFVSANSSHSLHLSPRAVRTTRTHAATKWSGNQKHGSPGGNQCRTSFRWCLSAAAPVATVMSTAAKPCAARASSNKLPYRPAYIDRRTRSGSSATWTTQPPGCAWHRTHWDEQNHNDESILHWSKASLYTEFAQSI